MNINKRVVAAIAAAVLALLGIGSLVIYAHDANDRAFEGTKLVSVVQVVDEVPVGTKAEDMDGSVKVVKLPQAAVPATAIKTLESVTGQVATAKLVPGEVLVSGRFGSAAEASNGGKVSVPKGLQEITIQLAPVRALDGKLTSGDFVGIAASYDDVRETNFADNKVLVLSSTTSEVANGESVGKITLRLAVNSIDAERIVHATEFGHVYLTKQGKDAEVDRKRLTEGDVLK